MTTTERETLIAKHVYIATAEAGKAFRRWPSIPEGDHFSAGVIGLMKAADAFDLSRGCEFKTLAGGYVRGEIKHQVRAWLRPMSQIPKAMVGHVRVDSLDSFRSVRNSEDSDCLVDVLPDPLDLETEALALIAHGQMSDAVDALPRDYACAVREVILCGGTWQAFGEARGWTLSQTTSFVKRFRAEIADRLRASRPMAEMVGGRAVRLPLTSGGTAIVDEFDIERLMTYRWHPDQRGFAYRMEKRRRRRVKVLLHHTIVGAVPEGHRVVALNRDALDCRRTNLVIVPRWLSYHRQAARNQIGLKGVRFHPVSDKWFAEIRIQNRLIHLGCFGSPKAAAVAFDHAAREYLGPLAVLNYATHG